MENTNNINTQVHVSGYLDRLCDRYPTLAQTHRNESKTSEKYSFVSTRNVLEILADNNWLPVSVQETRSKKYAGYQKHLIRLENPDYGADYTTGLAKPQIVLINAHLGTSSFKLISGFNVFACTNGLIMGDDLEKTSIRHQGFTEDQVLKALELVSFRFPQLSENIRQFTEINLTSEEQTAYAKAAIEMRFDEDKWAVSPDTILRPRRYSDSKAPTLWNTYQVVQEHLVRGGFRALAKNETTNRNTIRRTKEIKQIDKNVSLNRGLWTLTEEMAKIKARQAA